MKTEINSPKFSKINWTQLVSFLAMLLTIFGVDLPPETQVQIVAAILAITNVSTWVWRTFFTSV